MVFRSSARVLPGDVLASMGYASACTSIDAFQMLSMAWFSAVREVVLLSVYVRRREIYSSSCESGGGLCILLNVSHSSSSTAAVLLISVRTSFHLIMASKAPFSLLCACCMS